MTDATPTGLLLLTDDLFFAGKISGTARQLGLPCETRSPAADFSADAPRPRTVLADLEAPALTPERLGALREAYADSRLCGYCPHVKTHLIEAAQQAGFDDVLSRGRLSGNLPQLLREWCET